MIFPILPAVTVRDRVVLSYRRIQSNTSADSISGNCFNFLNQYENHVHLEIYDTGMAHKPSSNNFYIKNGKMSYALHHLQSNKSYKNYQQSVKNQYSKKLEYINSIPDDEKSINKYFVNDFNHKSRYVQYSLYCEITRPIEFTIKIKNKNIDIKMIWID